MYKLGKKTASLFTFGENASRVLQRNLLAPASVEFYSFSTETTIKKLMQNKRHLLKWNIFRWELSIQSYENLFSLF